MRGVICLAVTCLALNGSLRAQGPSGNADNPQSAATLLERGKPIEREMRGGESHAYKVHAKAGQFVRVVTLQQGVDVSVMLLDPSGKKILTADSMNGSYGPEFVSIIAEDSGDLQLDVSTSSADAPAGRYQMQLTDLRPPVEADRARITAERTYMEGCLLYARRTVESAGAAAEKWQQSFAQWQSLDDKYGQALSLSSAATAYYNVGDKQKALDTYNQALPLARVVGDRAGEASTLQMIGAVYGDLGDKQKALDSYNQALPLVRAVGDRAGEAAMLDDIGGVYGDLGERQKALDSYNQALPLERVVGNRRGEARTLSNIGAVYSQLGEKQKALDSYNQALPLWRAVGNRGGEATTLHNIGSVYDALGEKQKALDYYAQALPLRRAEGDRGGEGTTLHNIGGAYSDLGEMQKALDYYAQALPLLRAVGDRRAEAVTLASIGLVYAYLGEKQKPLDYYNQALPLLRAVGDRGFEAETLHNIGGVYDELGEKQKALDYYNQALPLRRAVGNRAGEATTLSNIGVIYGELGQNQKALDYLNQALPLERAVGDRGREATTLSSLGAVYEKLGEKQKGLDYYGQSLSLFRAVQNPLGEGYVLVDLMEYWKSLHNPRLAVLFGKQAIDRFQQVRRNIAELEKEDRQSFLKTKENFYRELAELLVSEGRLPEAQQVADLLKAEEYSEFTQRRGGADSETSSLARTPMEENANKEYEQITDEITTIGEQWTQLHAKSPRSADEEKRYTELSDQLTVANQRLQSYLKTLYESFGRGDRANARMETINDETGSMQTLVGDLGAGTVAVYTLVLDAKCVLMVITPSARVAREVTISRIALRTKVNAFVGALAHQYPDEDIQAKARDLYSLLIAPIEKDLQGAHPTTLVWSLDDVLRYVPLAALYDGKQYLVERYRNVMITTASAGNLKDQPQVSSWRGVAMGVSKDYDGLGQLTAVPGELAAVIHSDATAGSQGPVPGTILLNDSFTETSMESALERHPPLVHIASHYVFNTAGDDKLSYLLLGGKDTGGQGFRLSLADLRDDQRMDFKGIELLTLSGCETALGANDSDGREIDGLGFTAQRKGAKAVLATLWKVDDPSVGLLMAKFYRLWITTPGMTKAEALQQAQLALLHGTTDREGTSRRLSANAPASAPSQRPGAPYASPFYWAPFILIGNWK